MIKLFYSGAPTWKDSQTLASKSLGGFISKTSVPNGLSNSLFGDISELDLWGKKTITQFVGLGLYIFFFSDQEKADFKNLIFTLNYDKEVLKYFKDSFTFSVGIGPLAGDDTSGIYMEQIQGATAKPYYFEHDLTELKVNTPIKFEKVTTAGVGLWICRKFDPKYTRTMFECSSDYWLENDELPDLSFDFDISIKLEDVI